METGTIIWIIVAIIVWARFAAFVLSRSGARRTEADRAKAAEIREQADQHDRELREREASAAETKARRDSTCRAPEAGAGGGAAGCGGRQPVGGAAAVRQERDEQLRRAGRRDPDVLTDRATSTSTATASGMGSSGDKGGSVTERWTRTAIEVT